MANYILVNYILRSGFISTDIAEFLIVVWSLHSSLVEDNAVDVTSTKRDFIDSWTIWEQRVSLGCSAGFSQHGINSYISKCISWHICGMLCKWIDESYT